MTFSTMGKLTSFILFAIYASAVYGQQPPPPNPGWCGKYYMEGYPYEPVYGQFPMPAVLDYPVLRLGCAQTITPYLEGEGVGSVIVDATLSYLNLTDASPFKYPADELLVVTVSYDGRELGVGSVLPNSSAEIEIPLYSFAPQTTPYNLTCTAKSLTGELFSTTANFSYLPPQTNGSVVKRDARTGFPLVKNEFGEYEAFFALGFYVDFQSVATNFSALDEMKSIGVNVANIYADNTAEPSYNYTELWEVLEYMEKLGMEYEHSMRYIYKNLTDVEYEVDMLKSYENLLLWYTGDEPDGQQDPLNATKLARDLIYKLDGYHPVALVLNCEDYYFEEYTSGADLIYEDVYQFGINATWSVSWDTPVNDTFGDSGCDDCVGNFTDVEVRLDLFAERLEVLGESRTKSKGGVGQGFGGTEYWAYTPNTAQFVDNCIVSINHGAISFLSWDWNSAGVPDSQIKEAFAILGLKLLPSILPTISNPQATRRVAAYKTIDVALWEAPGLTLLMAVNMEPSNQTLVLPGLVPFSPINEIINLGAVVTWTFFGELQLQMGPNASVALFL